MHGYTCSVAIHLSCFPLHFSVYSVYLISPSATCHKFPIFSPFPSYTTVFLPHFSLPTLTSSPPSHPPHPHILPTLTPSPPSHPPHPHTLPTLTSSPPSHPPHPHTSPPSHPPHPHTSPPSHPPHPHTLTPSHPFPHLPGLTTNLENMWSVGGHLSNPRNPTRNVCT